LVNNDVPSVLDVSPYVGAIGIATPGQMHGFRQLAPEELHQRRMRWLSRKPATTAIPTAFSGFVET
jgi:hypothetical protein